MIPITKPTLVIDEARCRENIAFMAQKARDRGVDFRPHFKTHQSLAVGRWFKHVGVDKIAVSSLEMAQYFSEEWSDITVAFPVNVLERDLINALAKRIRLNLLVESLETVDHLKKDLRHPVGVFIKIDVGYGRTGLPPGDRKGMERLMEALASGETMTFRGFLAHAGHAYACRGAREVGAVHEEARRILGELKEAYRPAHPDIIASLGDTPSCVLAENFEGIDEIRPGNFVFYDLMQVAIGAATVDRIALAVACPVVAVHEDRGEMVIYGGGVHLSKEFLEEGGRRIYGRISRPEGDGWGPVLEGAHVRSLSQEHGVVAIPRNLRDPFHVGDLVMVLPVHACMAASALRSYVNKNEVLEKF